MESIEFQPTCEKHRGVRPHDVQWSRLPRREHRPPLTAAIIILLMIPLIGSCGGDESRIAPIIMELHSPDIATRDTALTRLRQLVHEGLTTDESIEALHAAADTLPPLSERETDPGAQLILAAATHPEEEQIDVVRELYGRYNAPSRAAALEVLNQIHLARRSETEALETSIDLIVRFAPTDSSTNVSDSFALRQQRELEGTMYRAMLAYLEQGRLSRALTERITPTALGAYRRYETLARSARKKAGARWMVDDAYADVQRTTGILLDLLGYIPAPEATSDLQRALSYDDPYLEVFAIISLLRHGVVAPGEAYRRVAGDPVTRWRLHDMLVALNRLDLFPREFFTQAALAESNMVEWLIYPTELGSRPDAIELMAVRTMETPDGAEDYYFYRFRTNRPDWKGEKGWMAGISGPYRRADTPTTEAGGMTFSEFERWSDSYPDEYMKAAKEHDDDTPVQLSRPK